LPQEFRLYLRHDGLFPDALTLARQQSESKSGPEQTAKFDRAADNTADDIIRRAQHPLHPCRTLLRDIRQRLRVVSSHVLLACATLKAQRADSDCDVSVVLRQSVGDELTRLIELLDSLLDEHLLKGDAP